MCIHYIIVACLEGCCSVIVINKAFLSGKKLGKKTKSILSVAIFLPLYSKQERIRSIIAKLFEVIIYEQTLKSIKKEGKRIMKPLYENISFGEFLTD